MTKLKLFYNYLFFNINNCWYAEYFRKRKKNKLVSVMYKTIRTSKRSHLRGLIVSKFVSLDQLWLDTELHPPWWRHTFGLISTSKICLENHDKNGLHFHLWFFFLHSFRNKQTTKTKRVTVCSRTREKENIIKENGQ